jgi:hypothetical protein
MLEKRARRRLICIKNAGEGGTEEERISAAAAHWLDAAQGSAARWRRRSRA